MSSSLCSKCSKTVYAADPKVETNHVVFHKSCFKCAEPGCIITLNLKNFEIEGGLLYCFKHVPKPIATIVTNSIQLVHALNSPKKSSEGLHKTVTTCLDSISLSLDSISVKQALDAPKRPSENLGHVHKGINTYDIDESTESIRASVTHPIDTIKVRLQLQGELAAKSDVEYRGLVRGSLRIISNEGFRGLYKGLSASLLREATYSTIRMGLYEPIKNLIQNDREVSLFERVTAGGAAGGIGAAVANPTDLIKVRSQANSTSSTNLWTAVQSIVHNHGWKGLYKGVGPNIQRAILLTGSQLPAYDQSKRFALSTGYFMEDIKTHCLCAMVAGLICATTTSPIDLVKSRYMNQNFYPNGAGMMYSSTMDCLLKTIKSEGVSGLYKGWLPQW